MSDKRVGSGGGPIIQPEKQQELETAAPVLQPQRELQKQPALKPAPSLRMPNTVRQMQHVQAKTEAPLRETAAMMLQRLEPLIQLQVQEILAAMEKENMKPEDVQASVAFNIVGRQEQVCAACGRIGHDFRPVMFAKANAEIELLEEDFVVSTQALARAGVSYSAIVYDEEILVLRDMGKPGEAGKAVQDLDLELQRFRAFKNRKTFPDPANREWLSQKMAAWRPEHAYQPVVGQANDLGMFETQRKIYADNPGRGGPKLFLLATSVAPTTGLQGQEFSLKKMGVVSTAIAVGKAGQAIAGQLFEETVIAHDAHDTREMVGGRIAKLVEMAAEQEVG
jgi:hypothetical protein